MFIICKWPCRCSSVNNYLDYYLPCTGKAEAEDAVTLLVKYIYIYIAYEKDNTKQYMLIKKRGVEKIILEEFSKGRFIFGFSSRKVRRTKI